MTERVTVSMPDDVRALIRAQARLALGTCAIVFAILGGLPLLFAADPGLSHIRVSGVRLPWLILCGVVPPVWVVVARRHVRLAERVERAFTEPARPE